MIGQRESDVDSSSFGSIKILFSFSNASLFAVRPANPLRQCLCNSDTFFFDLQQLITFQFTALFFLVKNKIMTIDGTFLLAKATSTATLARSPRVTIVPYMKMKQYWARGRILVQRGFVSRAFVFFNQTGNWSPPSPFFCLVCKQELHDPLVVWKPGINYMNVLCKFAPYELRHMYCSN